MAEPGLGETKPFGDSGEGPSAKPERCASCDDELSADQQHVGGFALCGACFYELDREWGG